MAEESETKVVKKGRGRPPKAEGEKKAVKRAASANGDAAPGAKKGRGRPKGTVKAKKSAPKKVKILTKVVFFCMYSIFLLGRG